MNNLNSSLIKKYDKLREMLKKRAIFCNNGGNMRSYLILFTILLCMMSCAPKGPTTVEMERDVKKCFIDEEKVRLEEGKLDEDESIKKWERLYSPSEREEEHVKFLFERQDWDSYLNSFISEMETLKVVNSNIEEDVLTGIANYLNSYGSKVEVKYKYIRTQKGWEFEKVIATKILEVSSLQKITPVQSAIIIFYGEKDRYPRDLNELVPEFVKQIPEGNWVYDNKTGKVKEGKQ